jgi:general transcription factor 3C polypeptide 3 (transcription factor C subunit 4)
MDQDTEMPNAAHTTYPDPTNTSLNPYPAMLQPESQSSTASQSPQVLPTTAPSTHRQSPSGLTQTDMFEYFNSGNKSLFDLSSISRPSNPSQQLGGASLNASASSQSSHADADPITPQRKTPVLDETPPFTLPGFHALPAYDRLLNITPSVSHTIPIAPRPAATPWNSPLPETTPTSEPPQESPPPARTRGTRGRGRGPGRPRGEGRRGGWRQALKGTEHAELFKTPRAPREAGGRKRGSKGRPKSSRDADPGQEYKNLQGQAMTAFLDNDLDSARELALGAIQANPEVWAPYSLLSEIYEKQGSEEKAIFALASGGVIKRDAELWIDIAARLVALRGDTKSENDFDFILKCYAEALKLDANHFEARKARMELYSEMKSWNSARRECGTLLSIQPGNLEILWNYADLCDKTGVADDLRGAKEEYEKAFQLYATQESFGDPEQQWDHLNMYLDLVFKTDRVDKAVYQLKRIARWFLGRQQDTFWNSDEIWFPDDREFDETPERRAFTPQIPSGHADQDLNRYGLGLPIEIRVKLGMYRLAMGSANHAEAFRHFECLRRMTDPDDIEHVLDLFLDVANNLRARGMFGAAVEYYNRLQPFSHSLNRQYWMNFAQCCREIGRNDEAEMYFKKIIDADENEVQARINLIKLYESTAQSVKALPIADEVIRIGRTESLKQANLSTYVQACKRIRKKASVSASRAFERATSSEEASRSPSPNQQAPTGHKAAITKAQQSNRVRKPKAPVRQKPLKPKPSKVRLSLGGLNVDLNESTDDEPAVSGNDAEAGPTFSRGANYIQSLINQKARVTAGFERVRNLWPQVETRQDKLAVEAWKQCAAALAKDFRLMKEFYPERSRDKVYTGLRTGGDASARNMVSEMEATKKRLLEEVAANGDEHSLSSTINLSTFHEIPFGEWHQVFCNLAIMYAEEAQQEECYDILQKVLLPANVFQEDLGLHNATLAVSLCCALIFNDDSFILKVSKQFQDVTNMAALHRLVAGTRRLDQNDDEANERKMLAWLTRSIDEHDYLAMTPQAREKYDFGRARDSLDEKAKKIGDYSMDAGLLTAFAHAVRNRPASNPGVALPYLFRALAIQPHNPVVNLSIATTYILQAARKAPAAKQSDIAHGLAFFHRYYEARVANGNSIHRQEAEQEAEFNMGRMWQLIDSPHLAVSNYEKVLKLSGALQDRVNGDTGSQVGGYAQEAAFALQTIYVAAGNEEAARSVARKWLVL